MSGNDWPPFTKPSDLGCVSPETVGIVIPMRNGLRFFKTCVHSVLNFTDYPYTLAVVDNMSDLPVKQAISALARQNPMTILRYDREFNFSAEVNLGLRVLFSNAGVRYGLILNSDAVVAPLWLGDLVKTFTEPGMDRVGIVGPVSNIAVPHQQRHQRPGIEKVHMVSGFCMLFKREVFERLGGFDEGYKMGGFEDWDFCERALQAGWEVVVNRGVHVTHFWKGSRRDRAHDQAMRENRQRFFEKYPDHLDAYEPGKADQFR